MRINSNENNQKRLFLGEYKVETKKTFVKSDLNNPGKGGSKTFLKKAAGSRKKPSRRITHERKDELEAVEAVQHLQEEKQSKDVEQAEGKEPDQLEGPDGVSKEVGVPEKERLLVQAQGIGKGEKGKK